MFPNKQLTGLYDPNCGTDGRDETPTFTNDGNHIVFSRLCWIQPSGIPTENLYIMNPDGTNITKLQGNGIGNVILFQPRVVGNKLVCSSNLDNPGTNAFELYSIMADGSNLTRLTNNSMYDGLGTWWMNYFPR